ncbi:MAG: putative bifunctional diguanylate cyclase/phosphodiesterase [Acidiferrobacter sp.]
MAQSVDLIVLLKGNGYPRHCGRGLCPSDGRVIRVAATLDGIHRTPALSVTSLRPGHTPRARLLHRWAPRLRPGPPTTIPEALVALVTDMLAARSITTVATRAEIALQRFPGIDSARIVLDGPHRRPMRQGLTTMRHLSRAGRIPNGGAGQCATTARWHAVMTLADDTHCLGFIDLVVRARILAPDIHGTLIAAGNAIASACQRERWRSRLQHLARLRSDDAAELSVARAEDQRAQQTLQRFSIAVEQSREMVFFTDIGGTIRYVNRAFEDTTGYSRDEAIGRTPRLLRSGRHDLSFYERLWQALRDGQTYTGTFINRAKNGTLFYGLTTITPLRDETGAVCGFVSSATDMTEQQATKARLLHLADHDRLTGLLRRPLFIQGIDASIAEAKDRQLAILLFDVDRFRSVHDTFGPSVGDAVLQELAGRLRRIPRAPRMLARIGHDEFALLLGPIDELMEAAVFADLLAGIVAEPFVVNDYELFFSISTGISSYPSDGGDAKTLIRNAGRALSRARRHGGGAHEFYAIDMDVCASERLVLEGRLRRVLEHNEMRLFYQPQTDLATGRIIGVEALMRWELGNGVLMGPAGFIPLLEETGLIVPIGKWALQTALMQMAAWRAAGFGETRVSVNISGRQLRHRALLATLAEILRDFPHCDGLLELELTESVLMEDARSAITILEALSDMGVRLAIDDFGTGYSSLSYLRRFPIDALKIDQSFVADLTMAKDGAAITKAIITLGHELSLDVIAEGVETDEQLQYLRDQHCDFAQGYLLGRPLPAADMTERLRNRPV